MNATVKNILALGAGFVGGSFANMGIIMLSGSIIPPPEGADLTTMEGLKASMHLFEPKHFLMPFLAHSIGTFMGACITGLLAVHSKLKFALGIGILFLLGGIANIFLLPAPLWYCIVDLLGAYIPMAYMGGKLAESRV
jgi:hypothetical protein